MAFEIFKLFGSIFVDTSQAKNEMDQAGTNAERLGKNFKTVADKAGAFGQAVTNAGKKLTLGLTTPIVGAGTAAFKLASDYNESFSKMEQVFKGNSGKIEDWAKNSIKQFGMAKETAYGMVSTFGDMSLSMGLSSDEAVSMSTSVAGLAADMASFHNVSLDVAQTALNSIWTGETESLKQFGIVMTQTNLDAFALSQGLGKTYSQMSQAEQVQLRYAYVMSVTSNAQGDFARTNDQTANQMRIFTEGLKELGASIGQVLLPMITPIIQKLNEWVQKLSAMDEGQKKFIVTIAGVVAAIGPLLLILGSMANAVSSIAGLFATGGIFNSALGATTAAAGMTAESTVGLGSALGTLLGPVALVVAAIAGVIAILVGAWQQSETFRNAVGTLIETIQLKLQDAMARIQEALAPGILAFQNFFAIIGPILQQIGDFIGNNIVPMISWFMTSFIDAFTAVITAAAPFLEVIGNIASFIGNMVGLVFALLNGDWASAWQFAQNMVQNVVGVITGLFNTLLSVGTSIVGGIYNAFVGGFNSLRDSVVGTVENLYNKLKNIWDTICGIFKGEIPFPKIKMPHVNISGKFSLNPPEAPHFGIEWYREGAVLNRPTLFGFNGQNAMIGGEAGPEAISPVSTLQSYIKEAVNDRDNKVVNLLEQILAKMAFFGMTIYFNQPIKSPSAFRKEMIDLDKQLTR